MGLSSKQVSSDGNNGWNQALLQDGTLELPKPPSMKRQSSQQQQQQQQQQSEPLNCPRCDSTNTKFCYYNNYNKSQPRHFCKTCKRHWTKGGTLRNVPIGGGRKNKRLKTSNSTTTTTKTASKTNPTTTSLSGISNKDMTPQPHQPRLSLPLSLSGIDDKNLSEAFYQTLGRQPPSSLLESSITFNNASLNHGIFMGPSQTLSLSHNDQDPQIPYSNLGNFENNPCSISSIQSSNLYNYTGEANNAMEETVMNSLSTTISSSSMSENHQPWMIPTTTSSMIDMSSNWVWDDFEKFVSVEADLTIPWDDTDVKP